MADRRVAILLISHVKALADGAQALMQQANRDVGIYACGGLEDGEIGTSIERIRTVIDGIPSDHDILVFYDIGSAKMNAEMAQEFEPNRTIMISDAPLIEGGYVATIHAGLGKGIEEVKRNAENSYQKGE
ncbi:dihydroxyacetone kinase phosphoryl donor subunit DhaM [Shouchella clausii]